MTDSVNLKDCIIGIDLGTSSAKVLAYSDEGKVLAMARRSYPLLSPQPGYAEQDPEQLLQAAISAITEVCGLLQGKATISGFSCSAAMHSLLPLDNRNQPLSPLITWADTRSSAEADDIRNQADAGQLYERTGIPMHPMTPLSKICWLRKNKPEIFSRASMFTGIKEYMLFHLLGVHIMDHSLASATGLFDIHTLDWYQPALDLAGITRNQLPLPVSPAEVFFIKDTELRRKWRVSEKIPFFPGSSDGCLANLGTGAVEKGDLAVTVGTSGAVRMASGFACPDTLGRTFNYILAPGLYISGGPVNNGGIILKWFTENFLEKPFSDGGDFAFFLEEAAKAPPGSEGLICLPYFMGERAPVWNAHVKGIFYGLQMHHKRAHMMRSIVEGISFSLYQIACILTESQGPFNQIFASGGFVQSKEWMQWLSDIFQKPVHITQTDDASAIGAAMLAWHALGRIRNLSDTRKWISIQQSFLPNPNMYEHYQKSFEIYTMLSAWEAEKNKPLPTLKFEAGHY